MSETTPVERRGPPTGRSGKPPAQCLRALVQFATLAPSGHNTQPWLFRIDGDVLELRADRTRALPVVDPDDRALVISCGAALAFLRVAIRALGHAPLIERLPDPGDPDLLARVRLGEPRDPTDHDAALLAAIERRRTNRRPFQPRPVPDEVLSALGDLARAEGAWLHVVSAPGEKDVFADLVADGDRRQAADPAFRRELATWIHPNHSSARDGMPGTAFGLPDLASLPFPWIIRTFDWGNGQAAKDRQLATESPALVSLGTDVDVPQAWLRADEALGMMLLHACAAGISASFLNQPIEVPALRSRLAGVTGVGGFPQLLLRLGYGSAIPPTPRRDVDEVLRP